MTAHAKFKLSVLDQVNYGAIILPT